MTLECEVGNRITQPSDVLDSSVNTGNTEEWVGMWGKKNLMK